MSCDVVRNLYASLNGAAWRISTSWVPQPTTPQACCAVYGIFCDPAFNVIGINLANNNLVGQLPALPASVQVLNIANNKVSGTLGSWVSASNWVHFDVSGNNLTGNVPRIPTTDSFSCNMKSNQFSCLSENSACTTDNLSVCTPALHFSAKAMNDDGSIFKPQVFDENSMNDDGTVMNSTENSSSILMMSNWDTPTLIGIGVAVAFILAFFVWCFVHRARKSKQNHELVSTNDPHVGNLDKFSRKEAEEDKFDILGFMKNTGTQNIRHTKSPLSMKSYSVFSPILSSGDKKGRVYSGAELFNHQVRNELEDEERLVGGGDKLKGIKARKAKRVFNL